MTGDEIRQAYLDFFEEKGHRVIPSSSLIPHGDPTLLLTTAGMVQFKPYFLGQTVPPSRRLASCQKCFRTTDIESVGDASHLTFFEMLGNFSIGDYFKKEAIGFAWEFVTRRLKIPPERLWVTVYLDDDEAFRIWREVGVAEDRVLRFGEEDNFWGPAGDSGPCGPCSEIHYDSGAEFGCGQPSCAPNCPCGRFSEIWNLVFVQYNQDREGRRTLLSRPSIDTGMGLERTAAVMQGKASVYETDLFAPLIELISQMSGKRYGADGTDDNSMRIVAEHSRGIAFLITDGVLPDNEGRGYVLRRLLRRTALFGRRLGLGKPFLARMARAVIDKMGHVYPELVNRRDFVLKVVELEEERFGETLSIGLELLDNIMAQASSEVRKKISGKQAFKLYDTYGFPVELTQEIARRQGFSVDIEGFDKEMGKQRERSRTAAAQAAYWAASAAALYAAGDTKAAAKAAALAVAAASDSAKSAGKDLDIASIIREVVEGKPTIRSKFVGYESLQHKSSIARLLVGNKSTEKISQGQEASLILEATPFYGEMGGQVGDTGEIIGPSGRFVVTNTIQVPPGIIVHQGSVTEGYFSVGDEVEACVDGERRLDIARNHTATHLLQFALRQVLGEHVQQRGSLVAPDRLRFDFSHLTAMTEEEIGEVQRLVNEKVRHNLPVYDQEVPYKQAIREGAIALFDEKYGDVVRVLRIGRPAISSELCGGTHVAATGETGFFQILSESSIGGGLRRIEAVTGRGAEEAIGQKIASLREEASAIQAELEKEHKQVQALERELAKRQAEALLAQVEVVDGIKVLSARVSPSRIESLRDMADVLRERMKSGIIVLGTVYQDKPFFIAAVTPDLVAKGYHAGDLVKKVAQAAGGSGGGKPTLAQGGGKDKEKLDEALRLVESLI